MREIKKTVKFDNVKIINLDKIGPKKNRNGKNYYIYEFQIKNDGQGRKFSSMFKLPENIKGDEECSFVAQKVVVSKEGNQYTNWVIPNKKGQQEKMLSKSNSDKNVSSRQPTSQVANDTSDNLSEKIDDLEDKLKSLSKVVKAIAKRVEPDSSDNDTNYEERDVIEDEKETRKQKSIQEEEINETSVNDSKPVEEEEVVDIDVEQIPF